PLARGRPAPLEGRPRALPLGSFRPGEPRAMTRPGAARVAIILLNHNGLQLTRDCLRSLLAIDYPDYRVFVIDNGSARDESVHLRRPYPEVRTDLTFINGCAFLLRRQAVEQVGLLDEDYYAYWEEGDYCLRLRRAGWRIACNPRSVIYHKGGQTNRYLSNLYIYYMVRNGFLCMKKNGR